MKIKKIISVVLTACMILSMFNAVTVSAEVIHTVKASGVNKIEAKDLSESTLEYATAKSMYRDYASANRDYPNRGCMAMSVTQGAKSLSFALDVEKEADYSLNIYAWGKGAMSYDIAVDGKKIKTASGLLRLDITDEAKLGSVHLPAGQHYLELTLASHEAQYIFLYYLTLEKREIDNSYKRDEGSYNQNNIPCIIKAEEFDMGANGSFSKKAPVPESYREDSGLTVNQTGDNNYNLALTKGEYARYTINAQMNDVYSFKLVGAEKANVIFQLDNEEPRFLKLTGREKEKSASVAVYVEKGQHILKLTAESEDAVLEEIRITSGGNLSDNSANAFGDSGKLGTANNVYKKLYVSEKGDDEKGKGTLTAPYKTLSKAKAEVAKLTKDMTGDIIVKILPGVYTLEETEVFKIEHGGANGYNVIYEGTDIFNPPVISGGVKVTGWTEYKDGIWSAPFEDDFEYVRQLYINEQPAVRAKSKYVYQGIDEFDDPSTGYRKDGLVMNKRNFPELSHPEIMETVWNPVWINHRIKVEGITYEEDTVKIKLDAHAYNFGNYAGTSMNFYLENAMELLDEPGEFYYNPAEKRIYYMPYDYENMTIAEAYVAKVEQLIKIEGDSEENRAENIIFDNLKIMYGTNAFPMKYGYIADQSDSVFGEHAAFLEGKDGSYFLGQIRADNADGLVIRNCEIACHGSAALDFHDSVSNVLIEGNIIRDVAGTGLKIGTPAHVNKQQGIDICRNFTVQNNVFSRVANEFFNNCGISVYYENSISILHNLIKDVPYTGISVGWGWNSSTHGYDCGNYDISYNHIENVMMVTDDGGGVYTLGNLKGAVISNNYMKNQEHRTAGMLYHDAGSANSVDFNNVLVSAKRPVFVQEEIYGTNNIKIYDNYSADIWVDKVNTFSDGVNIEYTPTIAMEEGAYPPEALAIINAAGPEKAYQRLEKESVLPEGRKLPVDFVPENDHKFYSANDPENRGILIEAEDFMEGGEGIAYHKTFKPATDGSEYRPNETVTIENDAMASNGRRIGVNDTGEWLKYKFEVEQDGYYYVDLRGWQNWDTTPTAKLTLDDNTMVAEAIDIQCDSWQSHVVGPIHITKGTHYMTMEFLKSFYFDCIRLYTQEDLDAPVPKGNDPEYDEGRIGKK